MEKAQSLTLENFISNWNVEFPDYPLKVADLKTPHEVIGALFQIFNRLGIDSDTIMALPPEESRNNHIVYYQDLLPVINMARIINYLVSVMPQVFTISISHFLQPIPSTSHSILLLLFNLMLFNEERLHNIAPYEEELFGKNDQVKILQDRKNKLLEMLNKQAQEKGKRAERLEKLDHEIKQYEEELKPQRELNDEEKQESEAIMKEIRQKEMLLEQKKTQKDALLAEVERFRALRVYDADDIEAQAEQGAVGVQEAEKKLSNLGDSLMQKENNLKNLQAIKHKLGTANNLLNEIIKQTECLKEIEGGDLDSESYEGELDVLHMELNEVETLLGELLAARNDAAQSRQNAQADRDLTKTKVHSTLREAEEKDIKSRERFKKSSQRIDEIKELTCKFEEIRAKGMEDLSTIKNTFCNEINIAEDILLKKVIEVKKRIEEKIRSRDV